MDNIMQFLYEHKDDAYGDFQKNLTPNLTREDFIGVRTPILRKYAKELYKSESYEEFLNELPHRYFDENQLHGFIISEMKDFDSCIERLEQFLPYINNWATCDQTSPKVFKKKKKELLESIPGWIASGQTYIIRFGIGMLMEHFLDEDFKTEYLDMVTAIRSEEYYVNMEIAWYMATALAKQWEATIPYIEKQTMADWTHNKTIQKARESNRIKLSDKEYLKSLKVR